MAKQLRIDLSGKPQSRQAMKLAKSISEIGAAEHAAGDLSAAQQQHAPVPHLRLLGAQFREMRVDLAAPLVRERPRRRLEAQIKPVSGMIGMSVTQSRLAGAPRAGQASMAPSITTTALPPIDAPVSLPPLIFSVSSIRLGRPIS